jgi:DNA-binding MarR family transcriptional regulator
LESALHSKAGIVAPETAAAEPGIASAGRGGPGDARIMFDLIELFFFAYRDFVGDADRLLEDMKFGRAHHRVLHFVSRHPGLTIAELLDILRITKQSLGRVLKELVDQGFIEARPGSVDRRQRLLYPSARGRRLALDLAAHQGERFHRALDELPAGARGHAVAFLLAMIDPSEREKVASLVGPDAGGIRGP